MHTYIFLPVVEMRSEPSRCSKVVSQALFGELVQTQGRAGDWVRIATPDGYAGWVFASSLVGRDRLYPQDIETSRLAAHVYAAADTEYGPLMTLPYGSKLQLMASDSRWHQVCLPNGQEAFIQRGDTAPEPFDLKKFLGIPYTWGGRSSFGYDCSGFVQMAYGRMGISLPRDAKEQILVSQRIETPVPGDLIFWGKSESDIRHVGIYLQGEQFIHTSARENKPYLRLSNLSDFEWSGNGEGFYPYRTLARAGKSSVLACWSSSFALS